MSKGDCFSVAAGFVESGAVHNLARAMNRPLVLGDKSPVRIVHGLPIGQGKDNFGQRYWHAWVECDFGDPGIIVFDYSNDLEIRMLRADYYRLGQIDEALVWRFTPREVTMNTRTFRHTGPWVPNWESYGGLIRPLDAAPS